MGTSSINIQPIVEGFLDKISYPINIISFDRTNPFSFCIIRNNAGVVEKYVVVSNDGYDGAYNVFGYIIHDIEKFGRLIGATEIHAIYTKDHAPDADWQERVGIALKVSKDIGSSVVEGKTNAYANSAKLDFDQKFFNINKKKFQDFSMNETGKTLSAIFKSKDKEEKSKPASDAKKKKQKKKGKE